MSVFIRNKKKGCACRAADRLPIRYPPPTPPFPLETEKGKWVFSESGSEHVENADESNDSEYTSTDYKPTFHF